MTKIPRYKKRIAAWMLTLVAPLCCLLPGTPASGQIEVEHEIVAEDDVVFLPVLQPVTVSVLDNDSDTDGHALTVTQVTQGLGGTVVIDAGATTVTYTPGPTFLEEDVFTYEVSDGQGLTAIAEVTVINAEPPPPRDSKGSYDGLIEGVDGSTGSIKVTLSTGDTGSRFTGSARFGGKKLSFRGSLTSGTAQVTLPGGDSLTMTLLSDLGFNNLTGQISVGGLIGDFAVSQQTFSSLANTPKAGKYTMVADADPNQFPAPQFPQGATWAKVSISKTGLMRIRGKLGDGKAFTAGATIRETFDSPSGEAPLFSTPYPKGTGNFSGLLSFADVEDPENPDFDGRIQWSRPAAGKGAYSSGFDLEVSLIGARFAAPRGINALDWSAAANQGQAFTDDGNQPNDVLKKLISLDGKKIKIDDPASDKFKLSIKSDGSVTGSFVIEGKKGATRLEGVVIQKFGGVIEGQFLGKGQSRQEDQVGWFGVFPERDDNTEPPPRVAR